MTLDELLRSAAVSVRRLENRGHTDIPAERERLRAFLDGRMPEIYDRGPDAFTAMVATHRAAGRKFQRVRIVEEPLTPYNRYMIWTGTRNAAAGEDVRYLARAAANGLDLPDHDFWVVDGCRLAELRFTRDGRYLGHDLIADPAVAARHEAWIARAATAAASSADYVAEDPTRAWPPARAEAEGA